MIVDERVEALKKMPGGTLADLLSNVQISKVGNGIFSSEIAAKNFIAVGIKDIVKNFDMCIRYLDLGGGEGFLAKEILDYLIHRGHCVDTLVADANEFYLKNAQKKNLKIWEGDIKKFKKTNYDLITMRAVNHYNSQKDQIEILITAWNSLKKNGYFVTQILSTHPSDCEIISKIFNLPVLGRALKSDQFHVASANDYLEMLKVAKFQNCSFKESTSTLVWRPEISWNRFNSYSYGVALLKDNKNEIDLIKKRKKQFLLESSRMIEEHVSNDKKSSFGKNSDGFYEITLNFPIIQAQKIELK